MNHIKADLGISSPEPTQLTTRPSGDSIKAQIFSESGTKIGTEFLVNSQAVGFQYSSTITGLAGGGFVVTWIDTNGTFGGALNLEIKAQIFSQSGTKVGTEFLVNTQATNNQFEPMITGLTNGGFVVTWSDMSGTLGDDSRSSVKAQVFSPSGAKIGAEFLVNTQTRDSQNEPTITSLADGGFVVMWTDNSGTLGDASYGVKAQVFSQSGTKIGMEFIVNTQTKNGQGSPNITSLTSGGFVATWSDTSGTLGDTDYTSIKAQVFSPSGTKIGEEFLVNTQTMNGQFRPTITGLADGGFVATWEDSSGTLGDASGGSIKAQIFSLTDLPPPANNLETNGTPVSGTVAYFDGFDTIASSNPGKPVSLILTDSGPLDLSDELGTTGAAVKASAGGNTITTGAGADTLTQIFSDLRPGATVAFKGGAGLDTLNLGAGRLTAFTSTIDPDGAVRFTAGSRTVIVSDVERFVIDGSSGSDVLQGSRGSDSFDGKGGDDIYNGSAGNDSYAFTQAGDTVTGEGSGGGIDSIWSTVTVDLRDETAVENLRLRGTGAIDGTGNALANVINGNAARNVIAGGLGNDKLYGNGGADAFVFAEHSSAHQDAILDFDADDRIILDGAVFQNLDRDGDGILDAGALQTGSTATGTGATLLYRASNGLLSYDADGAGSGGAAAIAAIGKSLTFLDTGDIRIKGQASTIGGQDTGTVIEDGVLTASGTLTVSDPDAGQRAFKVHDATAPLQGTFGTLEIDAQGRWTYRLNNADTTVQALSNGQSITDKVVVSGIDGTTHEVVMTIVGAEEALIANRVATFEEFAEGRLLPVPDDYLGFIWSSSEPSYSGTTPDIYTIGQAHRYGGYGNGDTDTFIINGFGGRTSTVALKNDGMFGVATLDIADSTFAKTYDEIGDAGRVIFKGYLNGTLVQSKTVSLSNDHFDTVALNFSNINSLQIVTLDGGSTANPGAGWWSIDNIGFVV